MKTKIEKKNTDNDTEYEPCCKAGAEQYPKGGSYSLLEFNLADQRRRGKRHEQAVAREKRRNGEERRREEEGGGGGLSKKRKL
jgi:hypothetical protein